MASNCTKYVHFDPLLSSRSRSSVYLVSHVRSNIVHTHSMDIESIRVRSCLPRVSSLDTSTRLLGLRDENEMSLYLLV